MRAVSTLLLGVAMVSTAVAAVPDDAVITARLAAAVPVRVRDDEQVAHDLILTLRRAGGAWAPTAWATVAHLRGLAHPVRLEPGDNGALHLTVTLLPYRARRRIEAPGYGGGQIVLGGSADLQVRLHADDAGWTGSYRGAVTSDDSPQRRSELAAAWGLGRIPGEKSWQQPTLANKLAGVIAEAEVNGTAAVTVAPRPATTTAAPIAAGSHPRLLFTADEVDELRRRATTPWGKGIVAAVRAQLANAERYGFGFRSPQSDAFLQPYWAAGHGLLYQLTGDEAEAERAWELCSAGMVSSTAYGNWWQHGYRVMGVALTYDMCFPAWDRQRRQAVYAYLVDGARRLAHRDDVRDPTNARGRYRYGFDGYLDDRAEPEDAVDAYARGFHAAGLMAALAVQGDDPLVHPPIAADAIPAIAPATGYRPPIGVPVGDFVDDKMPERWLTNGPFPKHASDPLAALGGCATVRPVPGQTVTVDGVPLDFRVYYPSGRGTPAGARIYPRNCARFWTSSTGKGYPPGKRVMALWQERTAAKRVGYSVVLYTVVRFRRPRVIQARQDWGSQASGGRLWLNHHELADGAVARVEPGLYPLLVHLPITGGYANQFPRLAAYGPVAQRADRAGHARALDLLSGDTPHDNLILYCREALAHSLEGWLHTAVDRDGWGIWREAETILPALAAYRRVTGIDRTIGTGATQAVRTALGLQQRRRHRLADVLMTYGLPFVDEAQRAVARGYLDRRLDQPLSDPMGHRGTWLRRPVDGLMALAAFPATSTPAAPTTIRARALRYDDAGVFTFASADAGEAGFTLLVDRGLPPGHSPFAAGHCALYGPQRDWLRHHHHRPPPHERRVFNTAFIDQRWRTAPAQVRHYAASADGSGAITLESTGYRAGEITRHDGKPRAHWRETTPAVRHRRAIGVDYSGRCGAPVLVVIYDRIGGTTTDYGKFLLWDLGRLHRREQVRFDWAADAARVVPTWRKGQGFGPSVAVSVFASESLERDVRYERLKHPSAGLATLRFAIHRQRSEREQTTAGRLDELAEAVDTDLVVDETLSEEEADLVAGFTERTEAEERAARAPRPVWAATVITVQDGDPPAVRGAGSGDDRELEIGPVRARFDGDKVVFE